jgi:hypothetical protein
MSVLTVLGEKDIYHISKKKDDDSICEEQEKSLGQEILLSLRKMADELKIACKHIYSNCTSVFKIGLPIKQLILPQTR